MSCRISLWLAVYAGVILESLAIGAETQEKHALLIGVTKYPNLPASMTLKGPDEDVAWMDRLLRESLGVDPRRIAKLSESAGEKDPARLPTRGNIEREFKALAQRVAKGDMCVVFLAGHGAQQPQPENTASLELDGQDELFLPRDAAPWDSAAGRLPGAITDDVLGEWLTAIKDRGAHVWLIVDSCHSGTMVRGPKETIRKVPANVLKIPESAVAAARERSRKVPGRTRGGSGESSALELPKSPGIVAFYACQADEVEVEQALPADSPDARPHGLFTYAICEVLAQAVERTKRPLTYREVLAKIRSKYVEIGRDKPWPLAEGADLDREVLGAKVWPGRSSLRLIAENKLNAGAVRGITPESVLEVVDDDGKAIGHVRVVEVRAFESDVVPCAFGGLVERSELPIDSACRLVFSDRGDKPLRVGIDGMPTGAGAATISTAIAELKQSQRLELVADVKQCDWFIRPTVAGAVLIPAARWSQEDGNAAAFGPYEYDERLGSLLLDRFQRIAQAEGLKRIAAGDSPFAAPAKLQIEVDLLRATDAEKPAETVDWKSQDTVVYDGQRINLRIRNPNDVPVDVTILYIDSEFGINCLFPVDSGDNRLEPGKDHLTERFKVQATTTGQEHLVVLAMEGEGDPIDLGVLAQPSLEKAPKTRGKDPLATPLGGLLARSMFRKGKTRGESVSARGAYAQAIITWQVKGAGGEEKGP